MTAIRRHDIDESESYWRTRVSPAYMNIRDPDGLSMVCYTGQPLWLNRYEAHRQRRWFLRLLDIVPLSSQRKRALDIGCGTGRWCRTLRDRGLAVTGIDIAAGMIERNRRTYPDMRFECVSILSLTADVPFDLVTSVTVLQHLPFEAQYTAVARIRAAVRPGAYVLLLENTGGQTTHVFARTVQGWEALFAGHGFKAVARRNYDFSPARCGLGIAGRAIRPLLRTKPAVDVSDRRMYGTSTAGLLARAATAGAFCVDAALDSGLTAVRAPLPSNHVALLFRCAN